MTLQEYYDELVRRSETGLFPAYNQQRGFCAYRIGDRKCGAGILIPDDDYQPDIETIGFEEVCEKYPRYKDDIPEGMDIADVVSVQNVHDRQAIDIAKLRQDGWNHKRFVERLNELHCFTHVNKVYV